jgi:integrase
MKVWKRKDRDVWIVDYRDPVTRKRVRMVGGTTREEAERTFAERKIKELREPVLNRAEYDLTVQTYAERWLTLVKPRLAQRTHASYTHLFKLYIWPTLGTLKLRELRRRDIKSLLDEQRLTLGKNTVRLIKAALSVLLAAAVDAEIVPSNVAAGPFKGHGKASKGPAVHAMSLDQLRDFKDTAVQMQREGLLPLRFSTLFLTMAGTGLRPSEALALQLGDLDLPRQRMRIERALDLDGSIKPTKTGDTRTVDLSEALAAQLRDYMTWLTVEALASGREALWLFPGVTVEQLRHTFARVLAKAELPRFNPYDLRHSFASLLLSENVPLLYVSQQLGHAKATTTLKFYARWMPSDTARYTNLLEKTWHQNLAPNAEVVDSTGEIAQNPLMRNQNATLRSRSATALM